MSYLAAIAAVITSITTAYKENPYLLIPITLVVIVGTYLWF